MRNAVSRSLFEMMPTSGSFFDKLGAHQTMLADTVRCEAYRLAIQKSIEPGSVVLDIGTGTGILALFAAQAGAGKIYAVETGDIASLTEEIVESNGYSSRVSVIRGNSLHIELPERVNLIISETVGFWGIDENILAIMHDAKMRHCLSGAIIMPRELQLFLVPAVSATAASPIDYWKQRPYGFDFSPAARRAYNNIYIRVIVDQDEFLSAPVEVGRFMLGEHTERTLTLNAKFNVTRSGIMTGLAGWFRIILADDVELTTDPSSEPLHWKHCFFPIAEPIAVDGHEVIRCRIETIVVDGFAAFSWHIKITDSAEKTLREYHQSTGQFCGDY